MSEPLGFVLVDKPTGPTSHDVVDAVRRVFGTRRVGHAGTLDPPASGLLVCGVGAATRLLRYVQGREKTYVAQGCLGVRTTTDDAEGEVVATEPVHVEESTLRDEMVRLVGDIEQVPPAVSAVKVAGERAYKRTARGENVSLQARPVTVHELELTSFDPPDFALRMRCSTGTYVRSLVRDLGDAVGCGAHVTVLRRLRIGSLDVSDAVPLDELDPSALVGADIGLRDLGTVTVDAEVAERLGHGQRIAWEGHDDPVEGLAVGPDGPVGVVQVAKGILRPITILPVEGRR